MNQIIDPHTLGFNYSSGWGHEPKPPVFHTAMKLCQFFTTQAREASDRAWSLEMALRDVRLATLGCEKASAVARLELELAKHLPPD